MPSGVARFLHREGGRKARKNASLPKENCHAAEHQGTLCGDGDGRSGRAATDAQTRRTTPGGAGRYRRSARTFRCPIWNSCSPSCGAAGWSPACAGRAAAIACRGPSGELRIADIILAVDEPIAATRCKTGSAKGCTKTGRALRHPRSVGRTGPADSCLPVVGVAGRCGGAAGAGPRPALQRHRCRADSETRGRLSGLNSHALSAITMRLRRCAPNACGAMTHALAVGGNPSSVHASGRAARAMVEEAREQVAAAGGRQAPMQVIFTSGATEANASGAVRRGGRRRWREAEKRAHHAAVCLAPSSIIRCWRPPTRLAERVAWRAAGDRCR